MTRREGGCGGTWGLWESLLPSRLAARLAQGLSQLAGQLPQTGRQGGRGLLAAGRWLGHGAANQGRLRLFQDF